MVGVVDIEIVNLVLSQLFLLLYDLLIIKIVSLIKALGGGGGGGGANAVVVQW